MVQIFRSWTDKISSVFEYKPQKKTYTEKRLLSITLLPPSLGKPLYEAASLVGGNEVGFFGHLLTIDIPLLRINIPLSLYTPPQEVSGGFISFTDLTVANQQAEQLQPEIEKRFPEEVFQLADAIGAKLSVETHGLSIHRHPGCFGFSGTDRDASEHNPGIIYARIRKGNVTKLDQVDIVYYASNDSVKICTVEARKLYKTKDNMIDEFVPAIEKWYWLPYNASKRHPYIQEFTPEINELLTYLSNAFEKYDVPYIIEEDLIKKQTWYGIHKYGTGYYMRDIMDTTDVKESHIQKNTRGRKARKGADSSSFSLYSGNGNNDSGFNDLL